MANRFKLCPVDKAHLTQSKSWKPPVGLDPKTQRFACNDCQEYWYKFPKREGLVTKQAVQAEFGVFL